MDKLDTMLAEEIMSAPWFMDSLSGRELEIAQAWLKRFNDTREAERALAGHNSADQSNK